MGWFLQGALPVSLSLAVAAALGLPQPGQAQSRTRIQAQAADLDSRFDAARTQEARDAVIAELETLLVQCGRQRNCQAEPLTASYRRMLQAGQLGAEPEAPATAAAEDALPDEGDEDEDPINVAADSVPDAATAERLLDERNRRFIEAVQFNPAVQEGIRRWLTDMRPALMESYVNYQYLRPHMAPAFQRAGLPEALLFGIMAKESNGKVHVSSRAGASGPLQFMPATGRRFGLGNDGTGFDTRFDARLSAEAAAAYLLERYAQLNGNIEMSLAAYNGGEGRALRIYNQSGGRSFWDASVYDQFPAETRDYVPMVVAAAWLYLHPQDYGLRFPRVWGAGRVTQLPLRRATSINELTICLGNARGTNGYQRALRNLNPRYRINDPLPEGTVLTVTHTIASLYNRYCVNGKRAEITRQLMQSTTRQAVVRVSDFVSMPQEPAAAGSVAPAASPAAATPAAPANAAGRPATPAASAPASRGKNPSRTNSRAAPVRTHRVARGETLHSIARRHGCTVQQLAAANGIRGPRYAIRPGQVLRLAGCGR